MLMSKKELLAIGCLLMAGGLFAVTDVAKETFEGATAGQSVTELGAIWGGSGSVAELTYLRPVPPHARAAGFGRPPLARGERRYGTAHLGA